MMSVFGPVSFAFEKLLGAQLDMDAMKYVSAQTVSDLWGISKRRVLDLCANNRIEGATRFGHMWAIPADAQKPRDARTHKHSMVSTPSENLIRKARAELKNIVSSSLLELQEKGASPVIALHNFIVFFSSKLLEVYIHNPIACLNACESFFGINFSLPISKATTLNIERFIFGNNMCLDDSLSWAYQFGSRESSEFKYKDTQFFTEKYMIRTLVDSLQLDSSSCVIDPASGGGNFLLYSVEVLVNQMANDISIEDKVMQAINKVIGYEIDPFLAFIASFNLKLKAITLISKVHAVTIETFYSCHPKVFFPLNDSIPGFLDINWNEQAVLNCDTKKILQLADIFKGTNVVITNPPFRTIKGMPTEQKEYLQEHYPLSKCDLCNAFIERILEITPHYGKVAMVTQNSWMYLDSFRLLRRKILSEYSVNNVWELGSNAFIDLSGEKANVVLVTFLKIKPDEGHCIAQSMLRNMSIEQISHSINSNFPPPKLVKQKDTLVNVQSRFDLVSTEHLKSLQRKCAQYKEFATPMQGTSTGDAENLIDFFWKHIGDKDWVLVSKGGGYSRFEGLNSYCVKWGRTGEYIRATKGSAIRNANNFSQTQLVYSDTGTAGLNVRLLIPGQIFVASGPGIRIIKGKEMAHLAFLNSRFATFYVRLASPKLTIAAGYIGQIPVTEEVLNSLALEQYAQRCLTSKIRRLSKRPNNIEFAYVRHTPGKSIVEMAQQWFENDLDDEWEQLQNEQKIEETISEAMNLTSEDLKAIDSYIGEKIIYEKGTSYGSSSFDDSGLSDVLGCDCFPKRTKVSKGSTGSDGLIEYISKTKVVSCERMYYALSTRFSLFMDRYIDLYMHALVISALRYRDANVKASEVPISSIINTMGIETDKDVSYAVAWIKEKFNKVHNDMLRGSAVYKYDCTKKTFIWIEKRE